jgi:hypothetical protein
MTEAEWFSAVDPAPLLRFVGDGLTDRHRLLFMAGCCRRVWDLLTGRQSRQVIETAEAVAEGHATAADLIAAIDDLPLDRLSRPDTPLWYDRIGPMFAMTTDWQSHLIVAEGCETAAANHASAAVVKGHPLHADIRRLPEVMAAGFIPERDTEEYIQKLTNEIWSAGQDERITRAAAERAAQTDLVRCVCGNPFRRVAADPAWLTSTVVALARGVHADRAFDRLPILADALQDAGCDDPDILAHCRGPHAHTLGCWVVGLLLG